MSRFAPTLLPFLAGSAIVAIVVAILWPRDAEPERDVSIPYRAYWATGSTDPDIETCYVADHARFFTVTDADNTVVNAEVVDAPGVFRMASDGVWYCEVEGRVLAPESDHYVLTFNDGTRYVVAGDDLGDRYRAPWVELEPPAWTAPFGFPAASPAAISPIGG